MTLRIDADNAGNSGAPIQARLILVDLADNISADILLKQGLAYCQPSSRTPITWHGRKSLKSQVQKVLRIIFVNLGAFNQLGRITWETESQGENT